jgi:hypothetical protein
MSSKFLSQNSKRCVKRSRLRVARVPKSSMLGHSHMSPRYLQEGGGGIGYGTL